jgi:hypothetical protein
MYGIRSYLRARRKALAAYLCAGYYARRDSFLASRQPLSHRDFCTRLGVTPDLVAWVVCVRRAMGCICGVPPSALYPDDTWQTLSPLLTFREWDHIDALVYLEELGVEFPRQIHDEPVPPFIPGRTFYIKCPAPRAFGGWVLEVAEHLVERGCRLTSRRSGPGPPRSHDD